jgi:hypothetical protein
MISVIHGTWTEDIQAHSGPRVGVVDQALEELGPVWRHPYWLVVPSHGLLLKKTKLFLGRRRPPASSPTIEARSRTSAPEPDQAMALMTCSANCSHTASRASWSDSGVSSSEALTAIHGAARMSVTPASSSRR